MSPVDMFRREFGTFFFVVWAATFVGSLVLSAARAAEHAKETLTIWHVLGCLVLTAGFAAILSGFRSGVLSFVGRTYTGEGEDPGKPALGLSKIRTYIKQERWDKAVQELEDLWIRFPGDGDVMREYERVLFEGKKDPGETALVLARFVPRLKGEYRAYAFLRLAEIHEQNLF